MESIKFSVCQTIYQSTLHWSTYVTKNTVNVLEVLEISKLPKIFPQYRIQKLLLVTLLQVSQNQRCRSSGFNIQNTSLIGSTTNSRGSKTPRNHEEPKRSSWSKSVINNHQEGFDQPMVVFSLIQTNCTKFSTIEPSTSKPTIVCWRKCRLVGVETQVRLLDTDRPWLIHHHSH